MTELLHTARELHAAGGARRPRAVVMTMGALHEGHAALIRAARERAGADGQVVVTVFVNPLQFGPNEDLDRYPRTLDADVKLAEREGADIVFAPSADQVYPGGEPWVRIAAGPMGERYEGASRPGHFDGMLTVVAKLLHLTRAEIAFFGQKDAQQLALIRRMAADLNFDTEIVAVPTVRESDGLAMSSRNRYLTPDERADALALSRALFAGRDALTAGPDAVRKAARAVLDASHGLAVDYLALVDPADFTEAASDHTGPAVLAVAAKAGTTRLIDNIPLQFGARR
ncbi:pantoate--beta-alanine ligase [Streptomyces sp. RB6PN25]|uniref:Pantothenate synthetase n=1 Tax=Streptomyces humicola TaxID=2953240 RepID=A0ABT1PTK9_9ACTN|nr:pantoate--beta-alanine ligase [Streptomyces humicola]MCQ4080996.1 pantoate--beta-alanine ligase [Streptomyces humicola]